MAGLAGASFRDRFWSPPVARAVTAPGSILLAGASAAAGVLALGPLGLLAGPVAYGVRVLGAVPRGRPRRGHARPDPFAVEEPWRSFVADALLARRRFDDAIGAMDPGPLRDRLAEIGHRLDDGVEKVWRVARQGHTLTGARRTIDLEELEGELAQVEASVGEAWARGSRLEQTAEALRAQVATARRMDTVIADAADRLRLLDARLDEAVTRAVELSTGAEGSTLDAGGVRGDVDGIVTEMEALRQALDEVGSHSRGTRPADEPGGAASAAS